MKKAEAKIIVNELKSILQMDVSWNKNEELKWDDMYPNLQTMGIDDLGDVSDYLQGLRAKLRDLVLHVEYQVRAR